LAGNNDHDKLADLCSKKFEDQAIWFLNAFWDDFASAEAENCWNAVQVAHKQDVNHNGVLDEFEAHRFLEIQNEEITVLAMRDKLRKTGAISPEERPKSVPLSHYLIFKYNVDWKEMVNAPQGSREEIEQAQRMLEEVMEAFKQSEQRDREAAAALRDAQAAEAEAKHREADAKAKEADARLREAQAKQSEAAAQQKEADAKAREDQAFQDEAQAKQKVAELAVKEEEEKTAKAELEAALAEVKAQEEAYNAEIERLKRKHGGRDCGSG